MLTENTSNAFWSKNKLRFRPNQKQVNKSNRSNGIKKVEITELRRIRTLLSHGDHDYKGHRVAAEKYITKAIHDLENHRNGVNKNGNGVNKNGKGIVNNPGNNNGNKVKKEKQALSDQQLRVAISDLEVVHQQLKTKQGAHHIAAANSVQRAVQELKTALSIR